MEGCFKQSREAFDGNNPELAQQLSLRGETHRDNMERLNKAASTKIFQENNQVCCFSYETPNRQPSVRFPAQPTPPVSPDVPSVTKPVRSHITQSPSQHTPYQPDRQPSARLPAQPTLPTSFDVDPVTEPVRSHIPRVCPNILYLALLSTHLFDTAITSFF
ncbi:hypothetical protein DFJ58DRAFT_764795 [Suillus subalutaceus]|uniref:uncharacterized protein n=1 Tax=Suillus subalutaceus TaxID=48586 RepID=UPI001B8749E8|nr:uncharacterized protein DFJ58DRAFT_764795 [Suillus subalutaceus]KAG1870127.1 hypothetical protein DFJ58DRAFT_764795 [Suillus subalutaceus]